MTKEKWLRHKKEKPKFKVRKPIKDWREVPRELYLELCKRAFDYTGGTGTLKEYEKVAKKIYI